MEYLTVLLVAVGLSMDAVAVSISAGMAHPGATLTRRLRMPLAFGLFQALMPTLGWLGGRAVADAIATWDHWLAFALLVLIGGKMLYEAWRGDDDSKAGDPFAWGPLLVLAVATSIDALAAGLSLALIGLPVVLSVVIIGCTTALLCWPAVQLGGRLGSRWATGAEIAGGVVLIGIGLKILVEHLSH